jgi:hypothetical protein
MSGFDEHEVDKFFNEMIQALNLGTLSLKFECSLEINSFRVWFVFRNI